jgi:hypothetical protein
MAKKNKKKQAKKSSVKSVKKTPLKKATVSKKKKYTTSNTGYKAYVSELGKFSKKHNVSYGGRGGFLKKASEIWREIKDKPDVIDNLDVILAGYLLYDPEIIQNYTAYYAPRQYYYWEIKAMQSEFIALSWRGVNDRVFCVEGDGAIIEVTNQTQASSYYIAKENERKVLMLNSSEIDIFSFDGVVFNENNGYDITLSSSPIGTWKPLYGLENKKKPSNLKKRKEEGLKEKEALDRIKEVAPEHEGLMRRVTGRDKVEPTTPEATSKDIELEKLRLELESKERISKMNIVKDTLKEALKEGLITKEEFFRELKDLK